MTTAEGPTMRYGEPPLHELLSEPIIQLLAQSDGVSPVELMHLCAEVRERLLGFAISRRDEE